MPVSRAASLLVVVCTVYWTCRAAWIGDRKLNAEIGNSVHGYVFARFNWFKRSQSVGSLQRPRAPHDRSRRDAPSHLQRLRFLPRPIRCRALLRRFKETMRSITQSFGA